MDIIWNISTQDTKNITSFVEKYRNDPFVQQRLERNLGDSKKDLSQETVWFALVSCLATSQQRSGPNSPVVKFINSDPFALHYQSCVSSADLETFTKEVLREYGLRFHNRLSDYIAVNFRKLENGLWKQIEVHMKSLVPNATPTQERKVANFIDENLKGFGPKQSRNLLQTLGLSRYEIPFDSRIIKWLNIFGFPFKLSATALSDRNYYELISDGVQQLCSQSNIYPCVLDAAIFTSYDKGAWTDENVIW